MKRTLLTMWVFILTSSGVAQVGNSFSYSKQSDPITDADKSFISVSDPQRPSAIIFVIRCNPEAFVGYEVFITTDSLSLGKYNDESLYVTHRLDSKKPVTQEWNISSNRTALFWYDGEKNTFTKALKSSKKLVVRFPDFREVKTYEFDVSGAKTALTKLKCLPKNAR